VAVREDRTVRVHGAIERWRIVWRTAPEDTCSPNTSSNCPCFPFAYGQSGEADLVRSRPGQTDDVFALGPLFAGGPGLLARQPNHAVIARWPVANGDHQMDRAALAEAVKRRPAVTVMDLADYNHDGWATEFELPIGGFGCAMWYRVVVGITPQRPEIHAFGSVAKPDTPLALPAGGWSLLRKARSGKVKYMEQQCGFRGGDTELEIELRAGARGVHTVRRSYSCDGERRLLQTDTL